MKFGTARRTRILGASNPMNLAMESPERRRRRSPPFHWLPRLAVLAALGGIAACMGEESLPGIGGESAQGRMQGVDAMPSPSAMNILYSDPAAGPTMIDIEAARDHSLDIQPHPPIAIVPSRDPRNASAYRLGMPLPLVPNTGPSLAYPPQMGMVSFYADHQRLATGGVYNPEGLTAAHKSLPFGTLVRCTRLDTKASVVVVINDRGPYIDGRIIDLSVGAARAIDLLGDGVAPCRVEILAYPLIEAMGPHGNG